MVALYANQADILRCYMRDTYHLEYLQSSTIDLLHTFFPSRFIERYKDLVNISIAFFYHWVCSSYTGYTIGEEDSGIHLLLTEYSPLSSTLRFSRFMISYLIPYIVPKLINLYLYDYMQTYGMTLGKIKEFARKYILARFFLTGKYISYADWLLGLRYFVKGKKDAEYPRALFYSYAGKFIAIQIMISAIKLISKFFINHFNKTKPIEINNDQEIGEVRIDGVRCAICMEVCKSPSTSKCGHVFCWTCILNAVQRKPQCPICRKHCKPQDIIFLYNI